MSKKIPNLLFIIPHFNNSKKLIRCVDSIIYHSKNLDNFSIFIVDDNSAVSERKEIAKLELNPKLNIEYLGSNKGVSNARNTGINYAIKNAFTHLSFIDCDDHLICDIQSSIIGNNDLIIYHSVETIDNYNYHYQYNNYINKVNKNNFEKINLILQEYSIRPNRIMSLASCWAKIYSIELILKNNIYFDIKMSTYEDVNFLLRYLNFTENILFQDQAIYAHTNIGNYKSLTFNRSESMNRLFSFLKIPKKLKMLEKRYTFEIPFNQYHFLACYYSITFIRLAIGIKSYREFMILYDFIKRRINSAFVRRCFANYDFKKAGGRRFLRWCVINKNSWLLTIQLVLIARKRYK